MNVSVVIPNFNGEKMLGKNLPHVLRALENSGADKKELIITDDASSDNSSQVIQEFINSRGESSVRMNFLVSDKNNNKGFSSNVDRGVSQASGDVIILINVDVRPSLNFLDHLLKHFTDEKVFAVGCMDESVEKN